MARPKRDEKAREDSLNILPADVKEELKKEMTKLDAFNEALRAYMMAMKEGEKEK
jgi:hypothetical protein